MEFFSSLKRQVQQYWRRRSREQTGRRDELVPDSLQDEEKDDGELNPPDASRVAARACCLAAVALRGLAGLSENEEHEFILRLNHWFSDAGLDDEIEATEREVIQAPAGKLDERRALNSCWRWEGAAVLAASLGRLTLPPHDKTIDSKVCGDACGVLLPRGDVQRLISNATFDADFDRAAYANRVLAINWRLRQFWHVVQERLDFAEYARGVQWAEFDLRGVELCEGDLAINGSPIFAAEPDNLQTAISIASERHRAANWLIGWHPIYSEVDTST